MDYAQLAGAFILLSVFGGGTFAFAKIAGIKATIIVLLGTVGLILTLMVGLSLMVFGDLTGLWWTLQGPPMN